MSMSLSTLSIRRAAALALLAGAAQAQTSGQSFVLESAVIDSRSGANLGVATERGELAALFRAQKAMTFGILRAAGVPLDSLSPELRARIERFQTTNLDAFRSFSTGLDLKDQGRYAEAREAFRRATELDPGFALAAEQQAAMPEVTLGGGLQLRAVVAAAAGQAVDRGKVAFVVDAARATAALQSGQSVVLVPAETTPVFKGETGESFANPAGSAGDFVPNLVAGLAFSATLPQTGPLKLALAGEWRPTAYRVVDGALESVGSATDFLAERAAAVQGPVTRTVVTDELVVLSGRWLSTAGASASMRLDSESLSYPQLGATLDWIAGNGTPAMPTSGTAVFSATGVGNLGDASGSIAVDFVSRAVEVRNLGFTLDGLAFSGLNGSTLYSSTSLSGGYNGTFSSGACSGCAAFAPTSSTFGGNFVGRNADATIFSTVLNTGSGTVAGVGLFKK
jgi:tetratricopeptide (TPR) repeat protein